MKFISVLINNNALIFTLRSSYLSSYSLYIDSSILFLVGSCLWRKRSRYSEISIADAHFVDNFALVTNTLEDELYFLRLESAAEQVRLHINEIKIESTSSNQAERDLIRFKCDNLNQLDHSLNIPKRC